MPPSPCATGPASPCPPRTESPGASHAIAPGGPRRLPRPAAQRPSGYPRGLRVRRLPSPRTTRPARGSLPTRGRAIPPAARPRRARPPGSPLALLARRPARRRGSRPSAQRRRGRTQLLLLPLLPCRGRSPVRAPPRRCRQSLWRTFQTARAASGPPPPGCANRTPGPGPPGSPPLSGRGWARAPLRPPRAQSPSPRPSLRACTPQRRRCWQQGPAIAVCPLWGGAPALPSPSSQGPLLHSWESRRTAAASPPEHCRRRARCSPRPQKRAAPPRPPGMLHWPPLPLRRPGRR
mmetsp:Transcript_34469/g.97220  ORF Transcript_34469/g.97220 Transcript_34469/m.97220 type:complete len:292 (-) Transcript_34469:1835-2710(-)